jgi:hypothetical protein
MTHTTYNDFIGLEDIEKKRGIAEFSVDKIDFIKMEVNLDLKPITKNNKEIIIIRNGKNKRAGGKGTELF